jgi:hypothetical protein
MQTLRQGFEERNLMTKLADQLEQEWRSRLASDYPDQSPATRKYYPLVTRRNLERFETLMPNQ